jgi:hypothetical protein
LTDGMKVLLRDATFRTLEIGAVWWQDVDTQGALGHGARLFRNSGGGWVPAGRQTPFCVL